MEVYKKSAEKEAPRKVLLGDIDDNVAADYVAPTALGGYQVIRRNGEVVAFSRGKIIIALTKAFLAERGAKVAGSTGARVTVQEIALKVEETLLHRKPLSGTFHIEEIQDQVELALMRGGHGDIARAYILYRADVPVFVRKKPKKSCRKKSAWLTAKGRRSCWMCIIWKS